MLTDHRHQEIVSRLTATGQIGVSDLAAYLRVSEETIRRDLKVLEERGILRRIHGGAVPPRLNQERPLAEREKMHPREKARVAMLAEQLVREGMSIFIDTGTSTLAFARRLVNHNVMVTTNSLDVAKTLAESPCKVKVVPGDLRARDNALVGYETVAYTKRYFFDLAVMGIGGCDIDLGWMDYEEHESVLRQALLTQSRKPVLLVDSGKFGLKTSITTFRFSDRLCVVTERPPPEPFLGKLIAHENIIISH